MPFASSAQARMAFATKKPWAKEWASKTDFASLPQHARKKAVGQALQRAVKAR